MNDFESLSHVRWDCKYHVVFTQSIDERCCSASCGRRLAVFCGICANRRGSKCWKGMPCPTTSTCV